MSQTVGDLLRSSLRKIGVLAAGEPLPAQEGNDAKDVLTQLVDAWSLESLLIPVVGVVTHPLKPGLSQYSIGIHPVIDAPSTSIDRRVWIECKIPTISPLVNPSITMLTLPGDTSSLFYVGRAVRIGVDERYIFSFVESVTVHPGVGLSITRVTLTDGVVPPRAGYTICVEDLAATAAAATAAAALSIEAQRAQIETARPEKIVAAFIRDRYNTDYILEIIDVKTFSRISRKTDSSRPSRLYIRKGWPLNTLLFESLPYADEVLHLEVIQPLSELLSTAALTTVIHLPPGYEKALIYNLCIDLAPEWGKQITPIIASQAMEGKKLIKRANFNKLTLGMDSAISTTQRAKGTYIIEQGP